MYSPNAKKLIDLLGSYLLLRPMSLSASPNCKTSKSLSPELFNLIERIGKRLFIQCLDETSTSYSQDIDCRRTSMSWTDPWWFFFLYNFCYNEKNNYCLSVCQTTSLTSFKLSSQPIVKVFRFHFFSQRWTFFSLRNIFGLFFVSGRISNIV